jgi:multiple sugar transport system substrate-binding protein/arabinosaccharide transport system substrate-binding protein
MSTALTRRQLLRYAAAVGGAGALTGSLAGCGNGSSAPVTSGPVKLAFWTHDDGYVKFFTAATTNGDTKGLPFQYSLSLTKSGAADLVTKMLAQAVAGRGTPDLAGLEFGSFPRLLRGNIASQLLHDLTADVADVKDDLIPSRTLPFSKDGRLYALDSDSPLVVYYHRPDQFAAAGVPTDLATWEELAHAGAQASAKKGVAFGAVAVGSDLSQVTQSFSMLLLQRGGRFFDENGNLDIVTAEAENTLSFIVAGLRSGFLTGVSDFYGSSMQAALKSNKLIGQFMASWYKIYGLQPNVPEQAGSWHVRALPRFAGGGSRTAFAGGTGFATLKDKPNTAAATKFLTAAYLTPSEQIRRYNDLGYLPTRRSVFNDPALLAVEDKFCGGQKLFEVFSDVIDEAPTYYQSANSSILDTVLSGHLLAAYNGDISPLSALKQTAADFRGQTRV